MYKTTENIDNESNTISLTKALSKAMTYCARGEKCEQEVREKLRLWRAAEEDIEAIIYQLVKEKFVDDKRYARAFTSDKYRFNQWGRHKIATMLTVKGISRETIDEALTEIDEERYHATLVAAMTAKAKTLKGKTPYERQIALYRFAASRGYENNLIQQVIENEL